MSRIGKKPIPIPKGVTVQIGADTIDVKGPKGAIRTPFPPGITFVVDDGQIVAKTVRDERALGKFHGLGRSLVANAVKGVTEGFTRDLDIVGVGFKAALEGKDLVMALGYSHPVRYSVPEGIKVAVEKNTHITVSGIDRQQVGQVAAEIRKLRKPDPYKQKGVRYTGEVLKKKAGKAGATGAK